MEPDIINFTELLKEFQRELKWFKATTVWIAVGMICIICIMLMAIIAFFFL